MLPSVTSRLLEIVRTHLPLERREPLHLRQACLAHCPVCGMAVRADDVIALVGLHVAHAECAIVEHLGGERHVTVETDRPDARV